MRKSLFVFLCFALIVSWGVTLNPTSSNAVVPSVVYPNMKSPGYGPGNDPGYDPYASSAPIFRWNDLNNAASYDSYVLRIAEDANFDNIVRYELVDIGQSSFEMTGLKEGKEYYWQVGMSKGIDRFYPDVEDAYRFIVPYDASIKPMNQPVEEQKAGEEVNFNNPDDGVSSALPIGFDFNFYGKKQDKLYASTNGLLTFGAANNAWYLVGNVLPITEEDVDGDHMSEPLDHFITAFHSDLNMGSSSKVVYKTIGETPNRKFVIQYTNMVEFFGSDDIPLGTFQVILYEGTNEIQFQYPNLVGLQFGDHAFGSDALIGIQGFPGEEAPSDYVVYSQKKKSLTEKQAIRFSPNGQTYTMLKHAAYEPVLLIPDTFPGSPTLESPVDGGTVSVSLDLKWSEIISDDRIAAASYEVIVARDTEFKDIVFQDVSDSEENIAETLYSVSGLEEGTRYYWKVKAYNAAGNYTFSNTYSFATKFITQPQPPTVVTVNASSITSMTASVAGDVIADGSATVAQRGIVYSLNANPTINDTKVAAAIGGTGAFTVDLAGLQSNTTYHSRAYAIIGKRITYGQDVTLSTLASHASLSDLRLSGIAFDQSVSGSVYSYTARVLNAVSNTKVMATVQDAVYRSVTANVYNSGNTLVFGPINLASGVMSSDISLNVGSNKIEIVVIALDGSGTTYTVNVTRAAAPSSGGVSAPSVVTSTDGKLTLPVGRAGEVSLINEIEITIPENASKKQLELTIEKVLSSQGLLGNKEILASSVFEILKNFTENFDKSVTITLSFDPSKLKSGQTVAIFYYDEVKKTWVEVKGGKINGNRISVKVNHFTKFAALVVDEKTGLPVLEQSTGTTTDPVNEVKFSDIAKHWAEASIKQAVYSGIVKGYTDGTFKPNATVTRAEFAVMLMNALKPQGNGADLKFTDNAKIGTWAQKAVAQAVQAGIIKGNQDGSFRPNAEVTRAEMAVMIANALGQPIEANTTTSFADDSDIPAWAKGSVVIVKQAGIVQGNSDNKYAPQSNATRAEAVTVLLKMLAQKNK